MKIWTWFLTYEVPVIYTAWAKWIKVIMKCDNNNYRLEVARCLKINNNCEFQNENAKTVWSGSRATLTRKSPVHFSMLVPSSCWWAWNERTEFNWALWYSVSCSTSSNVSLAFWYDYFRDILVKTLVPMVTSELCLDLFVCSLSLTTMNKKVLPAENNVCSCCLNRFPAHAMFNITPPHVVVAS